MRDQEPHGALVAIEVGAIDNDRRPKSEVMLHDRLACLTVAQDVLADADVAELLLERAGERAFAGARDAAEDDQPLLSAGRRRR